MPSLERDNIRFRGRRSPGASSQRMLRAGAPLSIIAQVAALGLMTIPAWLLGGVGADTQFWLFVVGTCATLGCWGTCLGRSASTHPLPAALIPLVLAVALGSLQLLPLPAAIHHGVSPRTQRWWEDLDPRMAPVASGVGSAQQSSDEHLSPGRRQSDENSNAASKGAGTPDGVGYPISLYPASTRRDVYLLALALAAFLLGATVFASRLAFSVAGILVTLNGAALSFFGLVQQLTWNGQLFWSIPLTRGGVPFASYVNRNNASGFLNICLGCAVALSAWSLARRSGGHVRNADSPASKLSAGRYLWSVVRRWVGRTLRALSRLDAVALASLTAAACIAAGILCSLSRGGIIAMTGGALITVGAASLAGRKRRVRTGAVILAAAAACWWSIWARGPRSRSGWPRCSRSPHCGPTHDWCIGRTAGAPPRTCCRSAAGWGPTAMSTARTSNALPTAGPTTPRTSIWRPWSKPGYRDCACCWRPSAWWPWPAGGC